MANTNLIEKVYNEVTKIGRISLLTYVKNGRKNPKNDMRMDSAYYREYASEWYSNCDTLNQLTLTPQAWLVFKYEGYDDDNKYFTKEIIMNDKGIDSFKRLVITVYNKISENYDNVYGKGKIKPEFEDYMPTTSDEEFGDVDSNGNVIYVYPAIAFSEENKVPYNAVVIGFQTVDEEQYEQEMSFATFEQLCFKLENYNLLNDSRYTMIEGMLYQLLENGVGISSSNVSKAAIPSRSSRPSRIIRPGASKNITKRQSLSEVRAAAAAAKASSTEDDLSDDDSIEDEEVIETVSKKVKPTGGKKTIAGKASTKISMEAILNDSENEELDLDDDGEEY